MIEYWVANIETVRSTALYLSLCPSIHTNGKISDVMEDIRGPMKSQVLSSKSDLTKDCVLGVSQALGLLEFWASREAGVRGCTLRPG
ncbi:hypothetical protein TNCV_4608481 [Trichonephila clavipes]|nr:hypothetical protein TNCV_4608481 [Trichonephila clavipes]